MRLYLAAPYAARDFLRGVAAAFTAQGFEITSRWLTEDHDLTDPSTHGPAQALSYGETRSAATADLADIVRADALVLYTADYLVQCMPRVDRTLLMSGGRHVETGVALALGRPVYVIGQPENLFHRSHATTFVDGHELQRFLEALWVRITDAPPADPRR